MKRLRVNGRGGAGARCAGAGTESPLGRQPQRRTGPGEWSPAASSPRSPPVRPRALRPGDTPAGAQVGGQGAGLRAQGRKWREG